MKRLIVTSLAAFALAACGQATSASVPSASPRLANAVINVATNPSLGSVLATDGGRTLYYFTPERGGTIACTGSCAQAWVPFLSPSGLLTTRSALPGTLATIHRPEGVQVTYSEWPLYTFAGDQAPGDAHGQGVLGQWFVATTTLTDAPISTPTPSPVPPAPTRAPVAVPPAPSRPAPAPTSCIPGMNGGDHDGDNNGGPSDLDGCK